MVAPAVAEVQGGSPGPLGREEILAAIERVLASGEFAVHEPNAIERLWLAIVTKWNELKFWFLEKLASALGGSDTAAQGVALLLILGAAAVAAYVIWQVLQAREADPRGVLPAQRGSDTVIGDLPAAELGRAGELARAGRYAEAMHALYGGVLLWLDVLGHARFDAGKTGGEYARELRAAELKPPFRALLSAFYPVAFGGRPGEDRAWRAMRSAASAMGVPE